MAKKITDLENYNPKTTAYPDGSLKDHVYVDGGPDEEGSRIYGSFMQDMLNVFHRVGRGFGKFLNGAGDTQTASQFYDWLIAIILHRGGNFYEAAATVANAYTLTAREFVGPIVYIKGLSARFIVPSDNTSSTPTIDVGGIGAVPLSDHQVEAGGSATVQPRRLKKGDLVDVMFLRSPDGIQHFQIVVTPLGKLTNGIGYIEETVGNVKNYMQIQLGLLSVVEQVLSGAESTTTAALDGAEVFSSKRDDLTGRLIRLTLNAAQEYFESYRSGAGLSFLSARLNFLGLNFQGGPNATDTQGLSLRFTRVVIPASEVVFKQDAGSPANWEATRFDDTVTPYYVNTDIPVGAEILSVHARYFAPDALERHRGAACSFCDVDPVSITNRINFTILSGDAPSATYKPNPNHASGYLHLHIWYNGATL